MQELALFNAIGETKYYGYQRRPMIEGKGQVTFPACIRGHETITHAGLYKDGKISKLEKLEPVIELRAGVTPAIII